MYPSSILARERHRFYSKGGPNVRSTFFFSKPKSLAVTVPRDLGDGERSQAQRHYRRGENILGPVQGKAVTGLRGELGKQAETPSANSEHYHPKKDIDP